MLEELNSHHIFTGLNFTEFQLEDIQISENCQKSYFPNYTILVLDFLPMECVPFLVVCSGILNP
jgi:hypothetical protein